MDIIDRRLDERLNKMGELKLVPAQVTAVRADFLRADVKLLDNGAEIKDMLNKTAEKLTVGQTVTIGYQTLPSSGVIMFANGEADLIRQGGGVEVETAALLDENNVHDWLADQELMLDISANTRLLYGGHQRMVSVQGYPCRFGTGVTLQSGDDEYFGHKVEFDVWWRDSADSIYVQRHVKFEIVCNYMSAVTSGGTVTGASYAFALLVTVTGGGSGVLPYTQTFTTQNFTDPDSIFIVPTVVSMSFADTFTTTWSQLDRSVSTPYGYCVADQLRIYFGVKKNGTINTYQWRTSGGAVNITAIGYSTVSANLYPAYKCVPLESLAEKCFDMGLTQRSEPITPNAGGGDNA